MRKGVACSRNKSGREAVAEANGFLLPRISTCSARVSISKNLRDQAAHHFVLCLLQGLSKLLLSLAIAGIRAGRRKA